MKTNAARLLDTLGVTYELRQYDPSDLHLPAEEVARRVGMAPEQVFKTLVVRGDRSGVLFALAPGDCTLDLKELARLSGDRRCDTVPLKEVQLLTGYVRGGVTALAARRPYATFVDDSARSFDRISVSAGVRGMQIVLSPDDYLMAAKATTGAIARAKSTHGPR
ncbi:MAG: Cys-tRNA(Pro) deacylase [Polyangiaceae bacterium]|jgi:Cys-tRNA(Pro)/Cys-tRNA(Cys) deacylase